MIEAKLMPLGESVKGLIVPRLQVKTGYLNLTLIFGHR